MKIYTRPSAIYLDVVAFTAATLLAGALALSQAAPATPPAITELEQSKLENLQLKFTMLQQQQMQLQSQYQELVAKITKEHPGYTWDAQKNQLVAVPPVKAEAPKPAKEEKK